MLEVFITVLIVYLIYYFVSISRYDKAGHLKKGGTSKIDDYQGLPSEVKFFIHKYKIDIEKVNLRGVLKLIGFILGIDIAILSILVTVLFKNNVLVQILLASILIIPLYLISIKFAGNYFKKEGYVKDEHNKRNRK